MPKKSKGCHVNCGSKCEATCKCLLVEMELYTYMFYFHGGKGRDFAHFIGSRPNDRKRNYTWVQSVALMFDTQSLVISANKVQQWDESVDVLVKWNGKEVTVPFDGDAEWNGSRRCGGRED